MGSFECIDKYSAGIDDVGYWSAAVPVKPCNPGYVGASYVSVGESERMGRVL